MDRGVRNNNKSLQEWLGLENAEITGPTTTTASPRTADVARNEGPQNHRPIRPTGMNLAEALAAERSLPNDLGQSPLTRPNRNDEPRPVEEEGSISSPPLMNNKVSLMRLQRETDGCDVEIETEEGCDPLCCVCMGRKKDAAFIPCGHTFCRTCAREVLVSRGSCALCNRSIVEVLDIIY